MIRPKGRSWVRNNGLGLLKLQPRTSLYPGSSTYESFRKLSTPPSTPKKVERKDAISAMGAPEKTQIPAPKTFRRICRTNINILHGGIPGAIDAMSGPGLLVETAATVIPRGDGKN